MKVVPCTREHIRAVKPQAAQRTEVADDMADQLEPEELAVLAKAVLTDRGRVIAVMGVMPVLPRVATAWAVLSQEAIDDHGPLVSVVAKRGLAAAMRTGVFGRIDMVVRADFWPARRWAEWLGFTLEGTKHNYGLQGDTDYTEWALYAPASEAA
jgi:hypothetical protein